MTMELLRDLSSTRCPPATTRALARRLQRISSRMCFEDGFVHADLHPGNMLLLEDGDIAIFDVGLVKQLAPRS